MSDRKAQLVFGQDSLVELMMREGREVRTITIDLFGAPIRQAGVGDPAVVRAIFAWGETEQLPPWVIGWEELALILRRHGVDLEDLARRHPAAAAA